ncbi:MAG: glutamine-hydrolyzing GMP synthase, partial [Pyrobaculum sp.]
TLGIDVYYIDAREKFLKRLEGVSDCEEKRKIIGEIFAEVFTEAVRQFPDARYLAQGTLYPDVIESGAVKGADKIKSHHNVGGLPQWFNLRLVEPLREFYKDEVRKIAKALGLPDEVVWRHPFPGPGLAVRIVGRFTREKLEVVRRASKIVEEELENAGLYQKVWQAFAVVGEDRWVGVKGDRRAVGYVVTVRVVESEDAMTADWARVPYEVLDKISRRITAEIPEVTMVTYAISSKPPSTIEPC